MSSQSSTASASASSQASSSYSSSGEGASPGSQALHRTLADLAADRSHHSPKGGFRNPPEWNFTLPALGDVAKMIFKHGAPRLRGQDPEAIFPMAPLDRQAIANPPADEIQVTWIGHATCLVQMDGLAFLTDPIFDERASMSQWFGPKRIRPPGMTIDELLELVPADRLVVMVSHDHYDHLCLPSVRRLKEAAMWFVPLGTRSLIEGAGVPADRVTERDWWQCCDFGPTRVVMVPAQHWCNRTQLDRNSRLWGGWVVLSKNDRGRSFYFAGDTGYCPVFKTIGERLGPIACGLIPIGAYEPRWFMAPQHIDPAEAVQVHQDVKANNSVGIHFGTFLLTIEPIDEPPRLLREEAAKAGLEATDFVTIAHGETHRVPKLVVDE